MGGLDIITLLFLGITIAVSIGLHEYAHALISYKLGDPTPKLQNRLTPNPLAHIDPIGFLLIFIIHFGRGKPVEINPSYYKNPARDELFVAIAGPITNLILAILGIVITIIYLYFKGLLDINFLFQTGSLQTTLYNIDYMTRFWTLFSVINIALAIFNMLPIPPLDGFRLIKFYQPYIGAEMQRNSMYFMIGMLVFLFTIGSGLIGSISNFVFDLIYSIIFYFIF